MKAEVQVRFVELTNRQNGKSLMLSVKEIVAYYPDDEGTAILTTPGVFYTVHESFSKVTGCVMTED